MAAQNITIIGAGIAGLATALAFARNGHDVDIIEQAQTLSEVGAGLQISPNASRILIRLGLEAQLADVMTELFGCPELTPDHKGERAGDVKHSLADLSRITALIGYEPLVGFADGLGPTCEWYRESMLG